MTLLTIAQSILKETKSGSVPTTIIGNVEDVAKQMLEVMTVSVTELARSYDWQELQKEKTFSTVAATVGYNLPTDFDRFINNTFWNETSDEKVVGPVTPEEYRILKTDNAGAVNDYFRIRAGQVLIYPIPSSIESMIYEYVSNLVVLSSSLVGQSQWLADTDLPAIDAHMVRLDATWRWLKNQGRPYAEDQKIANSAIAERARINGARRTIRHHSLSDEYNFKVSYPTLIVGS